MPRTTTTLTFTEEIDRIQAEREDLAAAVADVPEEKQKRDNPAYAEKLRQGSTLDTQLAGLKWARDGTGDPDFEGFDGETVVLGALTTAEHKAAGHELSEQQRREIGITESERDAIDDLFFTAKSLQAAPFLDDDAGWEDAVAALSGMPPQFTVWLETQRDSVSSVGLEEGNSFADLVSAASASETSTDRPESSSRKSSSPRGDTTPETSRSGSGETSKPSSTSETSSSPSKPTE